MVAVSSKVVAAQATAVRKPVGLSSSHQNGKNTIDSALCRAS